MEVRLLPPEPAHRTSSGRYLPKVENPRKRPHLSPAQVTELAEEVHPDFRAIVLSMGVLGLRPSEAIALREGLDLDRAVLHVRRAAVDVPGKGMVVRDQTTAYFCCSGVRYSDLSATASQYGQRVVSTGRPVPNFSLKYRSQGGLPLRSPSVG
jgi:hypothetical protein